MKIFFLPPRQWKLQRERLQADFTKALDNFQRAQRSAAQKEKEAIKKYKNQGVSLLMHKQVMNLENKRTPLRELLWNLIILQNVAGSAWRGWRRGKPDWYWGRTKQDTGDHIKYKTFISLVFVVSLLHLSPIHVFPVASWCWRRSRTLSTCKRERGAWPSWKPTSATSTRSSKTWPPWFTTRWWWETWKRKLKSFFYQGEMVDSIEANVESASIRVNEGSDQLRMAERYQVRFGEQSCHVLNHHLCCEPAFQFFVYHLFPICFRRRWDNHYHLCWHKDPLLIFF